jgi:hypothetical protein
MKRYSIPLTILLVAAFILSGCGAIFPAPLATPLPPEMMGTEIVETSAALATQTALNMPATSRPSRTPRPSETPRATYTPSITPSPTIPFVVYVPYLYTTVAPTETPYQSPTPLKEPGITFTPFPTTIPIYGATVYSQKPASGATFAPGAKFTATWLFSNDTKRTWSRYEVDFIYWAGDSFYASNNNIIDLPQDVPPNGIVNISVNMVAPSTPGSYATTYLLHEGNRYYITVTMFITVVK